MKKTVRKYKGYEIIKKISTQFKKGRSSKSIFYCVYEPNGSYNISLSDEKLKEAKLNIDNQLNQKLI